MYLYRLPSGFRNGPYLTEAAAVKASREAWSRAVVEIIYRKGAFDAKEIVIGRYLNGREIKD